MPSYTVRLDQALSREALAARLEIVCGEGEGAVRSWLGKDPSLLLFLSRPWPALEIAERPRVAAKGFTVLRAPLSRGASAGELGERPETSDHERE
jgi:hypothetical protein